MSSWTEEDRAKADRYAADALRGVGVEDRTINDPERIAMHYRRETNQRERDYVFKTSGGRVAAFKHDRE